MLLPTNRPSRCGSLLAFPLFGVMLLSLITASVRAADAKPLDDYVVAAQSECFTSKRIFSCFRYKAARYLWSAASGRMNWFDMDNSRTLMAADRASGGGSTSDPQVQSSFRFVQLSEPSTALVFPGARQEMGDTTAVQLWKFIKRSWATFLNAHGIRFGVDSRTGGRIFDEDADDDDADRADRTETINEPRINRKKKWQVIVPLAILGKLMHLKLMLMQILLGVGAVQVTVLGGGALLYYYLKHHTICRFEPHVMHSHSHVSDVVPGDNDSTRLWKFAQRSAESFLTTHGVHFTIDNKDGTQVMSLDDDADTDGADQDADTSARSMEEARKKKRKYKKKKWHIILPLAILLKLTHLKLLALKVLLGVGAVQLILVVFGALLFHYLKNNTLCKVQPHLVHTHSHIADHEPDATYSSYSQAAPYGSTHGSFAKDWASRRAYSAYSFLDAITDAD